jgi:hypothetical protein
MSQKGRWTSSCSTGVCGRYSETIAASKARYSSGFSDGSITVSAVNPCLRAFRRDRCFPSSVFGPVLLRALRRFASRREVMGRSTWLGRPASLGLSLHRCLSASHRLRPGKPVKRSVLDPTLQCQAAARLSAGLPPTALEQSELGRSEPSSTTEARCARGGARGGASGRAER